MHYRIRQLALATTWLLATGSAGAGFELISRTGISAPIDSNGDSYAPTGASADGRFVVFGSSANNLVAGDTNHANDLFLYDATLAQTVRVSVGSGGVQAQGETGPVGGVSNDGRYVVFDSTATNLGDSSGRRHVYLHDRELATTVALTQGGSGSSGDSANPRISADGRYVVFDSTTPFDGDDTNGVRDIYRLDRQSNTYTLISVSADGRIGNADSFEPQISADGNSVAFHTWANNLVAGDSNGYWDLLLRRIDSATLQRVSLSDTGAELLDFPQLANAALSADGRYVLFNLLKPAVADDTNDNTDGYRFDSQSGSLQRVTLDSTGGQLYGYSPARAIAADGLSVLMQSSAPNVFPGLSGNVARQFLRRLGDGGLTLITFRDGPGPGDDQFHDGLMSADAATFFASSNSVILPGDSNGFADVYRQTSASPSVQRLSAPLAGSAGPYPNGDSGGWATGYSLSGDGRFVAFASLANNLVVGDFNASADVFLRDRLLGTTQRISLKPDGGESFCWSQQPAVSANGRYVAFLSCGDLGGLKLPLASTIYRYDRLSGGLELVSALADGSQATTAYTPRISADGDTISFWSCDAAVAGNGLPGRCDVYVRNQFSGEVLRASPRLNDQGGDVDWQTHALSADGRHVLFNALADNLVAGDSNGAFDAFVFDTVLQTTQRVSVDSLGQQLDGHSIGSGLSADGSLVVFSSDAPLLGGSSATFYQGVFLRDRGAATTTLVSRRSDGVALNLFSEEAQISASGAYIVFASMADNQPGAPPDTRQSVYFYERPLGQLRRVVAHANSARYAPPRLADDGNSVIFASSDDRLSADDGNGHFLDVFFAGNLIDLIFRDGLQATP